MDQPSQPAVVGTENVPSFEQKFAEIVDNRYPQERREEEIPEGAEQGQPEGTPPSESSAEDPQPTYKVKVDGKEIEVPLEELIAGYQKDADYRQKTAALADQRRDTESAQAQARAAEQQANAERHQAAMALTEAGVVIRANLKQFEGINWQQLAAADPAAYVQARAAFDAQMQQLQQVRQQFTQLQQLEAAQQLQFRERNRVDQQQALLAKLEDWKDPAKASAEKQAISKYLLGQGYSESELDQVDDHRAVLIARKAMLFDALMAQQGKTVAQVKQAPARVEHAGTGNRPGDGRTSAMKQLARTGSVRDAAAVLKGFL